MSEQLHPFSTNVPLLYRRRFYFFKGYRTGDLLENGLRKQYSKNTIVRAIRVQYHYNTSNCEKSMKLDANLYQHILIFF